MACKVLSVYCDILNPGNCDISYTDCTMATVNIAGIPPGGTVPLDG